MMLVKNDLPSLPIQKWMTRKSTSAVIEAITRTGGEARFVGGCVRDTLAGKAEPQNIDIATPIRPEEVLRLLEALDDHDDVQNVSANFNIPDEVLAEISES